MTVKNSVLVHRGALLPPYTLKHNITRKMYARVLKGLAFAPWSDKSLVLEELQHAADNGLSADVCCHWLAMYERSGAHAARFHQRN